MIKLKKNEPVRYDGVYYDFTMLDEYNLRRVYNENPKLRHLFYTDDKPEDIIVETTDFEEQLAKVGILTSNMTAKKMAEIKKRKEDDKANKQ